MADAQYPTTTAGMSIGNPVSGGGANRLIFEDGSQNLAASANLTYGATANQLKLTQPNPTDIAFVLQMAATPSAVPFKITDNSGNLQIALDSPNGFGPYIGLGAAGSGPDFSYFSSRGHLRISGNDIISWALGGNPTIALVTGNSYGANAGVRVIGSTSFTSGNAFEVTDGANPIFGVGGPNNLTFQKSGSVVASAAAITPTGNVFHVSGTATITSITSTNINAGTVICIIFDGALTFTDGSNLKLNGNFVTTADDTITLVYDGTNWYEIARSVN